MKSVLESKDLKLAHQKILRAILSLAQESSSQLTATEPLALLSQVITIADGENEEEYSHAIRELVNVRWIIGININPGSGLTQYRISHAAELYIRKLDNITVSKEMARSHA